MKKKRHEIKQYTGYGTENVNDVLYVKDGAYKLKIFYPRCVIMEEMCILTNPIEIQRENWG